MRGWSKAFLLGLLAACATIAVSRTGRAIAPTYSVRSPFHPEQCERAIEHGRRRLSADPSALGARMLVGEGLLCRGLATDNAGALAEAIELFNGVLRDQPENFQAQLELADAERKLYPASAEAETSLRRARAVLARADVGAARAALETYLNENLEAVVSQQDSIAALWGDCDRSTDRTGAPADVAGCVMALAQTGPGGLARAQGVLEGYLSEHADDALATVYRAETLRGTVPDAALRDLYAEAEHRLCGNAQEAAADACALARWRTAQLRQRFPAPQVGHGQMQN